MEGDVAAALGDPRGNSRCGARGMDESLTKQKKKRPHPHGVKIAMGGSGSRVDYVPLLWSVRLSEFSASA